MILSRLQSPTDSDALEELSVLSVEALEKAMWILKAQNIQLTKCVDNRMK